MRKWAVYICTMLLLCGVFAPHTTIAQDNKALILYTDALKRLTIHGDSVEALRLTKEALVQDSLYAPANYLLARLEQDPKAAWIASERAFAEDTTNIHYLALVGEKSLRANEYSRAKQVYNRLIKDSDEPEHFRVLAALYSFSKEPKKGIAVLDSAEVRLGRIDFFSRMKQQLYLDSGEADKALSEAQKIVNEAPYNPENHIMLANLYAELRADSLANDSFSRAIKIDRKNPSTWFEYAAYLDSRNRHGELLLAWRSVIDIEDVPLDTKKRIMRSITSKLDFYKNYFLLAETIISRLYELYPDDLEITDAYATHLVAGNRSEEALQIFKKRVNISTAPTKQDLGRILEIENYLNRTDSLSKYVNIAVQHHPEVSDFWTMKAWLQMRKKDNAGAITTLKSALKYAPDSISRSSLWGSIGDQYYELGETKKSYAAYNKALSYNLKNSLVLNNYAYHLSVTGKNLKTALQMAKRATELSKSNPTYLDTLAWVYYKLGEFEEAKKVMQLAMSFDKDNSSELALHYGDILEALNKTFMAQLYWRKALERGADAKEVEKRIEAQKARLAAEKNEK